METPPVMSSRSAFRPFFDQSAQSLQFIRRNRQQHRFAARFSNLRRQ